MKNNFQKFIDTYLLDLTNSIKKSDISAIEKASKQIHETIKKKLQFLFVATVVLQQLLITIFVII